MQPPGGRLALLALLLAPSAAPAQGFVWPAPDPPCNTTLQACIDGAVDGAVVAIDSNAPTNVVAPGQTALTIAKALSLQAAPGRTPRLPGGIGIRVQYATPFEVAIEGLVLGAGAGVEARGTHAGGVARLRVRRMRFEHLGVAGFGVDATQTAAGTLEVDIEDNRLLRTGGAGSFFVGIAEAGRLGGRVRFNHVDIPDGGSSAWGIIAAASGTGTFDLAVHGNRVRGAFVLGAICGASAHDAPVTVDTPRLRAASNIVIGAPRRSGVGICAYSGAVPVEGEVTNNTVLQLAQAIRFSARPFSPPASPAAVGGFFANNLVAYNDLGVVQTSVAAAVTNTSNLYFGNASNGSGFSAGSGSVFANPLLRSIDAPYLLAGSPAIDAGMLAAVPVPTLLPRLDADGLRRARGAAPDIGALESGDAWFGAVATAANISGNWFVLEHPSTDGQPLARVFATPNFSLGNIAHDKPFGVWWISASTRFGIFNQDLANMPVGAGYNVMVPAPSTPPGAGPPRDGNEFLARAPGGSPSFLLDDSSVNGRPDAVIVLTQNFNPQNPPLAPGAYNDHVPTLQIFADDRWRIANADGATIPANAAFNVYAQPPSPSAFTLRPSVSPVIAHPLLDGTPCARIQATPVFADANARWDLFYDTSSARWVIFRTAPGAWPAATRFNIVFSPRQVHECAGTVFGDGFEP